MESTCRACYPSLSKKAYRMIHYTRPANNNSAAVCKRHTYSALLQTETSIPKREGHTHIQTQNERRSRIRRLGLRHSVIIQCACMATGAVHLLVHARGGGGVCGPALLQCYKV